MPLQLSAHPQANHGEETAVDDDDNDIIRDDEDNGDGDDYGTHG